MEELPARIFEWIDIGTSLQKIGPPWAYLGGASRIQPPPNEAAYTNTRKIDGKRP